MSSRPRGRRDDGFFPRKRKRKRARRARDSVPRRAGDVHGRVPGSARAGQRSSPAAADGRGRSCLGAPPHGLHPAGEARRRCAGRWACSTACCGPAGRGARERPAPMRASLETLLLLDAGEIERVDRARAEAETRTTDPASAPPPEGASSSAEPLRDAAAVTPNISPNRRRTSSATPTTCGTGTRATGTARTRPSASRSTRSGGTPRATGVRCGASCEAQAERVPVNGVLAGLRTRTPPRVQGDGGGAAGTVAGAGGARAARALRGPGI